MAWGEELTLQFIEIYRIKEILWNTKHPDYYNKIKKNDAWNELAEHFQTTAVECKKKVNNLLSALRREKAKMKKPPKGRSGVYESNWFAFKSLLFLWDKSNLEAQTSANSEGPANHYVTGENEYQDDWTGNCQFLWKEETHDANTKTLAIPAKRVKKEPNLTETVQREVTRSYSEGLYESSESEVFGKLVAAKHEKLDPIQRMYAESIIINTLNKASLQKLTETTTLSDTSF